MISVVLPTHNPDLGRLRRTLDALVGQSLPRSSWELLVVDNASSPPLSSTEIDAIGGRLVLEPTPGLTPARLAGIRAARGDLLVFVDDDNVLAPDFLVHVLSIFTRHPQLGAAGGKILPEFASPPPAWAAEFYGLLALRDLGAEEKIAPGAPAASWPDFAPVGAGLCVRHLVASAYAQHLAHDPTRRTLDRTGRSFASGGDNDLVFTVLHAGWGVGYFPQLTLTHLIPSSRLAPDYLAQLNEGIMRTWVRVLNLHGQCPWRPISPWTVPLRAARAWFRFAPWRSPANRIRWRGAVGQFQGQADLSPISCGVA